MLSICAISQEAVDAAACQRTCKQGLLYLLQGELEKWCGSLVTMYELLWEWFVAKSASCYCVSTNLEIY